MAFASGSVAHPELRPGSKLVAACVEPGCRTTKPGAATLVQGKEWMKKIIIIALGALLLAGGGAAAFFLLNKQEPGQADVTAGTEGEAAQPAEPEGDPIYLALDPAFVVNFEHNGGVRYLQLSLQVMAYQQEVIDKVAANMPAVRNNLILLFSSQNYEALNTLEGKESLRKQVAESINEVVRLSGENRVDDVYFTGFVVQ